MVPLWRGKVFVLKAHEDDDRCFHFIVAAPGTSNLKEEKTSCGGKERARRKAAAILKQSSVGIEALISFLLG